MRRWSLPDPRPLARPLQRAGLVAAMVSAACCEGAVAEETRQTKFGALVLAYDADTWSVLPEESGFTAECMARRCKGRVVTARALPRSTCEAEDLRFDAERASNGWRAAGMVQGDLHWLVARWRRGCRNAHPESLAACALYGGTAYWITAPLLTYRTEPQSEALATIMGASHKTGPDIR